MGGQDCSREGKYRLTKNSSIRPTEWADAISTKQKDKAKQTLDIIYAGKLSQRIIAQKKVNTNVCEIYAFAEPVVVILQSEKGQIQKSNVYM